MFDGDNKQYNIKNQQVNNTIIIENFPMKQFNYKDNTPGKKKYNSRTTRIILLHFVV